ncbi:MAG TPA: hypothetical protein VGD26_04040 [Chitinophagaceae bacterium]
MEIKMRKARYFIITKTPPFCEKGCWIGAIGELERETTFGSDPAYLLAIFSSPNNPDTSTHLYVFTEGVEEISEAKALNPLFRTLCMQTYNEKA